MKSKKEKKLKVLKRVSNIKLRFKDVMSEMDEIGGCNINLNFNKEAVIDGCKAVSDYGDNRITLKVDGGLVIFEGSDLYLYSFDSGCAIIKGTFTNVNYDT